MFPGEAVGKAAATTALRTKVLVQSATLSFIPSPHNLPPYLVLPFSALANQNPPANLRPEASTPTRRCPLQAWWPSSLVIRSSRRLVARWKHIRGPRLRTKPRTGRTLRTLVFLGCNDEHVSARSQVRGICAKFKSFDSERMVASDRWSLKVNRR